MRWHLAGAAVALVCIALATIACTVRDLSSQPRSTPMDACRDFVLYFGRSVPTSCYCAPAGVGDNCTARVDGAWFLLDCGDGWCEPEIIAVDR